MNIVKKAWAFLTEQVTQPPEHSQTQILMQIAGVLSSLDEKLEALAAQFQASDHRMQVMHERQIAILEKLNFMMRQEEKEIAHIECRRDEVPSWFHQGKEQNP